MPQYQAKDLHMRQPMAALVREEWGKHFCFGRNKCHLMQVHVFRLPLQDFPHHKGGQSRAFVASAPCVSSIHEWKGFPSMAGTFIVSFHTPRR